MPLPKMLKPAFRIIPILRYFPEYQLNDKVVSAPFSAISKKLSDSTLIEVVKKEELFKIK